MLAVCPYSDAKAVSLSLQKACACLYVKLLGIAVPTVPVEQKAVCRTVHCDQRKCAFVRACVRFRYVHCRALN